MRSKLVNGALFAIALLFGALGLAGLDQAAERAGLPVAPEFVNPPSTLGLAPGEARPGAWFHDMAAQGRHDGTLVVFAAILFMATLLHVAAPQSQRRMRTSVFFFFVYLLTLPVGANFLSAVQLEPYGYVRGVALFCLSVTITHLAAIFIFDVVLAVARVEIPPILRELITGIAYVFVGISVLSRGGVQLSGLLTTSAILTAVIGLSIQSTLGDMVSGLAIEWEGSINVGDWVKVGDVTGLVKHIRWRHMTIETRNWESVILPNSVVMKSQVNILGKRTGQPRQLRRWLYFQVPFSVAPTAVIAAVEEGVRAAPIARVAQEPAPNCQLMEFREYAAYYALRYWLTDIAVDDPTDSVVRTRIYFALQRAGIELALPERQLSLTAHDEPTRAREEAARQAERLAVLQGMDLFTMLTPEERQSLVPHLRFAPFARGEVMTRQGADAHWLYLLVRGDASVQVTLPDGSVKHVASLHAGDHFGEMALLTGEKRAATVLAETDCVCWRLDREGFKEVVQKRPEIAGSLASVLASRRVGLNEAQNAGAKVTLASAEHDLFREISTFFGLSG
jgi:small-conductance mechanosensitive channel